MGIAIECCPHTENSLSYNLSRNVVSIPTRKTGQHPEAIAVSWSSACLAGGGRFPLEVAGSTSSPMWAEFHVVSPLGRVDILPTYNYQAFI